MSDRIFARLARFMYSVSCTPELVPRLVFEHDCVEVVAAVFEPSPPPPAGEAEEGRQLGVGGGVGGGVGVDVGGGGGGGRSGVEGEGKDRGRDRGGGGGADGGSRELLDNARETCAALLFNLSTQV